MISDFLDGLMDFALPVFTVFFCAYATYWVVDNTLARRKQASANAEYAKRVADYEEAQKAERQMKAETLQVQKDILSQLKEIKQLLETGATNVHSR